MQATVTQPGFKAGLAADRCGLRCLPCLLSLFPLFQLQKVPGDIEDVQAVLCQSGQDALALLALLLFEGFHDVRSHWLPGCSFFLLIQPPFLKVDIADGLWGQRGRGCVCLFYCWSGYELPQPLAQIANTERSVHR